MVLHPTRQPFSQDGSYLPEIDKLWEYLSVFPSDNVPQELGVFIAQGSSRFEDIHRFTPYIEQDYVSGNGIKFCIELVSQPINKVETIYV